MVISVSFSFDVYDYARRKYSKDKPLLGRFFFFETSQWSERVSFTPLNAFLKEVDTWFFATDIFVKIVMGGN